MCVFLVYRVINLSSGDINYRNCSVLRLRQKTNALGNTLRYKPPARQGNWLGGGGLRGDSSSMDKGEIR